jgi:hypothetical protein
MGKVGIGAKVVHPSFGEGVIFGAEGDFWRVYFKDRGEKEIAKVFTGFELLEGSSLETPEPDLSDIVTAVTHVFEEYIDALRGEHDPVPVALGEKWDGGMMLLQPEDKSLKPKEVPIDAFFHKIVMARDRMRVLEAKINAHADLSDADKVELQQYITRIYGSFTTFNVLFKYKEDWFVGEKKD